MNWVKERQLANVVGWTTGFALLGTIFAWIWTGDRRWGWTSLVLTVFAMIIGAYEDQLDEKLEQE